MIREERREAPRHDLQLQLKIRGIKDETAFIGQAKLINISKGGFVFTPPEQTTHPYCEGQIIEAEIMLPGPPAIGGRMRIKGKINRLSMTNSNQDEKRDQLLISVQFLNHFKFSRAGKAENTAGQSCDESR